MDISSRFADSRRISVRHLADIARQYGEPAHVVALEAIWLYSSRGSVAAGDVVRIAEYTCGTKYKNDELSRRLIRSLVPVWTGQEHYTADERGAPGALPV